MSWEDTKKLSDHVRKHGIVQFINLYKRLRDRQGDVLKWGDEVIYEYILFYSLQCYLHLILNTLIDALLHKPRVSRLACTSHGLTVLIRFLTRQNIYSHSQIVIDYRYLRLIISYENITFHRFTKATHSASNFLQQIFFYLSFFSFNRSIVSKKIIVLVM